MSATRAHWLTIVGIGEDGLRALGDEARRAIDTAEVLIGGKRHLEKVAEHHAEKVSWGKDFDKGVEAIRQHEGKRVVVLASGDPMYFGVGSTLGRRFDIEAMTVIPAPGAFSLAAARMGWSLPDVSCLTVHGRALETVNLYLHPDARLLILSWDGATPAKLAALLTQKGYGESKITVMEHMGGVDEQKIKGAAQSWNVLETAALNTIAVTCVAGVDAVAWSRAPGLPEDAFEHDNMVTKREVRAATISALAPLPGETLWDVGAGSGTVAIEWLRLEPSVTAIAIERHEKRVGFIRANAANLGVPRLQVVEGLAPEALDAIEGAPDAVFIGGGVSDAAVMEACWGRLADGGRLVANAVTLEAQQSLLAFRDNYGGRMTRLSIAREDSVGPLNGMRPMMEVWQLYVEKT